MFFFFLFFELLLPFCSTVFNVLWMFWVNFNFSFLSFFVVIYFSFLFLFWFMITFFSFYLIYLRVVGTVVVVSDLFIYRIVCCYCCRLYFFFSTSIVVVQRLVKATTRWLCCLMYAEIQKKWKTHTHTKYAAKRYSHKWTNLYTEYIIWFVEKERSTKR